MTVDMSDFDEAVAKYMGALNKSASCSLHF